MIDSPLIRIVDDDSAFRTSQRMLLNTRGWEVQEFDSAVDFLQNADFERPGCILLDVRMPQMTGLELQTELEKRHCTLPVIFLTGHGDISMAVHAMQHGAATFLEKPVPPLELISTVSKALEVSLQAARKVEEERNNKEFFETLTAREQQIVKLAALDTPNKVIARQLDIAEVTVKMHRAHAFAKLNVKSPLEAYRTLTQLGIELEDEKVSS